MTESNSQDEEAPKQQVFTGVPCKHEPSQDVVDLKKNNQHEDDVDESSSFKMYSVLLGALIGCFIQISSLAANYYLHQNSMIKSTTFATPEEDTAASTAWSSIMTSMGFSATMTPTTQTTAIVFSVIWSFFTSTLGVIVMLGIRSMLQQAHHKILLECYFAAGALAGVCLAWMGTDVALGMHRHLLHSACTLGLAVVWCKVLCLCFPVEDTDTTTATNEDQQDSSRSSENNPLEEPLLVSSSMSHDEEDKNSTSIFAVSPFTVKATGLFLGTLIGLFIQFSSMGANFFVQRLCNNPVVFSLVWSFVTSTMGITVLVLIRALLAISWSTAATAEEDEASRQHYALLLHVECFFALGATLGLNFAWTVTDMALGLESHILQSFCTLIGTIVWCKLVMFCCGYCRTE